MTGYETLDEARTRLAELEDECKALRVQIESLQKQNAALRERVKVLNGVKDGERKAADFDIEAANARLIAAAPELLAACKLAYKYASEAFDAQGRAPSWALVVGNVARAAIAKATGGE